MKHITMVCELIVHDVFTERDIKNMLDASPHIVEAHMDIKVEKIKEPKPKGDNNGVQPNTKRW